MLLTVWANLSRAADIGSAQPAVGLEDTYRADVLEPVRLDQGEEDIQILREPGTADWPAGVYALLEQRIRAGWDPNQLYGPVYSSVGLWLRYPLVTARIGGRVLIPVLEDGALRVRGSLEAPRSERGRRVVILVDTSESANAPVPMAMDSGARQLSLLKAERRALANLVTGVAGDAVEFGILAFGEGTWPVVELGAPLEARLRGLAQFEREHPEGEGRSDAVCALWTAVDWLRRAPDGVDREIVLLTGADLPHSGRFLRCSDSLGESARRACDATRNRTACPASHEFSRLDGLSDIAQLASLGREVRGELVVTPVLFGGDRNRRLYTEVARRTGGRLAIVPSARALQELLPALVTRSISGVFAHNRQSGVWSDDLLRSDGRILEGEIPLVPGANDIELRIASDGASAGLFRFRVYSAPGAARLQPIGSGAAAGSPNGRGRVPLQPPAASGGTQRRP